MSLYVLDTDTLSLFQRGHPAVLRNVFYHLADPITVTPITVEEQLGGWFTVIRSARTPGQIAVGYDRLAAAVKSLATWDVLPYTHWPRSLGSRTCSGNG